MKALRMISPRGDDTLAVWDETTITPERLQEIQREFDDKMARGYFAANIDTMEITKEFDPNANTLLIPRVQGGL